MRGLVENGQIVLIDKPKGISSFDVIRVLRKTSFPGTKMGHAGTLDPLASGLMVLGVGEGTKRLSELIGLPKTYEAEVLLGVRTTTGDMEGDVVEERAVGEIDETTIEETLEGMQGTLELPVPIYSAVKMRGKPLYARARRGEDISPPIKPMEVRKLEFKGTFDVPQGTVLKVICNVGSGTYIRSLAEEVGRRLSVPATLYNLRRTKVGEFSVEDAVQLDT